MGNKLVPRVLFIGNEHEAEFAETAEWLRKRTCVSFVREMDRIRTRSAELDYMLLAQSRPGQISGHDVARLHALWPLTPQIALLGSWCEGETRTGKPWPGIPRIYWHQWRPRLERYLFDSPGNAPWRQPRSASETELSLVSCRSKTQVSPRSVILSCSANSRDSLTEALQLVGTEVIPVSGLARADAAGKDHPRTGRILVFDTPQLGPKSVETLRTLISRWQPEGCVISTDFLRVNELLEWRKAGATIVLARPWLIDDLAWCLEHAAELVNEQVWHEAVRVA